MRIVLGVVNSLLFSLTGIALLSGGKPAGGLVLLAFGVAFFFGLFVVDDDDDGSRLEALEDALDMAYVADIEQQSDGYYTVTASYTNGFWQDHWDMERVRDDGFVVLLVGERRDVQRGDF